MKSMLPAVAVLLSTTAVELAAADDAPVWHKNYAEAKALAAKSKRPLFVVFR